MGTKFVPSLANLFMSEWEDKLIFAQRRSELLFYKRSFVDLFFVWVGSEQSLMSFLNYLNANEDNITLDLAL